MKQRTILLRCNNKASHTVCILTEHDIRIVRDVSTTWVKIESRIPYPVRYVAGAITGPTAVTSKRVYVV